MAKKNVYIDTELSWAESQLKAWKKYVDDRPLDTLDDRRVGKSVISIEAQGKFLQETIKNYLALLEVVNRLREAEHVKKEARGSAEVPHRMQ